MRFSLWPGAGQSWSDIVDASRRAGAAGWDGVWVADHFMPNQPGRAGPMHEAVALVAGLAASVPRVRIGTLVLGNTYRHPAVLAKAMTTADHISGGRVVLGLGAGWQENEHAAYGIEFSDVKGRLDRFEEACALIRSLLDNERTTFAGTHYQLSDAPLEPKPLQPRMPLLVGGGGEKRTLRVVARHADEWNVWSTPDVLRHKSDVLARHCETEGRDPASISRSTQAIFSLDPDDTIRKRLGAVPMPTVLGSASEIVDRLGQYRDAGCDEFIVPDGALGRGEAKLETIDRLAAEVFPALR